jgi:hypothetical protein
VSVLLWPLFPLSAWAQPATVVAGTTGEDSDLATVSFVVVSSDSHCSGGDDM